MRARSVWLAACGLALVTAACAGSRAGEEARPVAATTPPGSVAGLEAAAADTVGVPVVARLAGPGTAFKDQADAYGFALRNVGRMEDITFARGTDDFVRAWTPDAQPDADGELRAGLGPRFNAVSCASCHVNHGRGLLAEDLATGSPPVAPGVAAPSNGLLLRLSVPGTGPHGEIVPEPTYGDQLQDQAIPGVTPEGRLDLRWDETTGTYGDGTPFTLHRPVATIGDPALGHPSPSMMTSPRLAPPVIGLGLLEAVPEEQVVARADPGDADGDGIRGVPNRVWDAEEGRLVLGRFGWKASQPTVETQTGAALFGDMGLTSPYHPAEDGSMELTQQRFDDLVAYTRLLAVPAMRNTDDPEVHRGAQVFGDLGCAACHTPTQRTEAGRVVGVGTEVIHPFTDLLLHDLGDGLADGRPDGQASGRQWRTPPLWGIGLTRVVGGTERYLHDGRAQSVSEAILWHGGEAEGARERFRTASAADRSALLAFLSAL